MPVWTGRSIFGSLNEPVYSSLHDAGNVMIDMGAHHGGSAVGFARRGWTVHAFEPDLADRRLLKEACSDWPNVNMDGCAISKGTGKEAPFFRPCVSDGVSSVASFRDSHAEVGRVRVVSLRDVSKELAIQHANFLKIDAEGMDYAVLRDIPWDDCVPDMIVCGFEDAKTVNLGQSWCDISELLVERGYSVYVSEWYPIARHGGPHQWRSLRAYPCVLLEGRSWSKLLAFRNPPLSRELQRVLDDLLVTEAPLVGSALSGLHRLGAAAARRGALAYLGMSDWLQRQSPMTWRLLRSAKRRILGARSQSWQVSGSRV